MRFRLLERCLKYTRTRLSAELPVKTRALLALAWQRVISDWLFLDHLTKKAMTPDLLLL